MNRYTWRTGVLEVCMIVVALLFMLPLYVLFNVALKENLGAEGPLAPASPATFVNFGEAFEQANLLNAFVNTTVIAAVSLTVLIFFSSIAGYAIARHTGWLSRGAFITFGLGLLLPFQLATLPLFQMMRALGLLGTVWSLVLFYTALLMPFTVFLYAAFLRAIPRDYEEAAEMDGAGPVRIFFSIVFPMVRSVTGTVVILNIISIWNDFLTPRLYLAGTGTETLIVALNGFVGKYASDWPLVFAGILLASAPILILFFVLQRYIIKGFAAGLKG